MLTQAAPVRTVGARGGLPGRIIDDYGWSATSLGPVGRWPDVVRTTVELILRLPVPIVTLWGEDGVMIYSGAYSGIAGGRHPRLLGSKVREGWPDVADFNDNVMKVGLAGGTLSYRDQELTLHRTGKPEQVWMNLDYSPIVDAGGAVVGVIAIVVETTAKVRAERWLSGEHDRLQSMFEQAPGFMAQLAGADHVIQSANAAYRALAGQPDPNPLRIVLVEDEDEIRDATAALLRHLGHDVLEAVDAEQALGIIAPASVMLITDVQLPGMTGDLLAAQARILVPGIRIVFATGKGDVNNWPHAVVLRKPYDLAALATALANSVA
jgi:CheY-like chemotaxis protein